MIGYACINMTLKKSDNVFTGRSINLKNFTINKVDELALKNIDDLYTILKWNVKNAILFFRMSSDIFPRMYMYEISELPSYNRIKQKLQTVGNFIKQNNIRLTTHPSAFNILSSNNQIVVDKTIKELNQHSEIFDLMQLDATPMYKINIHIGAAYNDKTSALERFCKNFQLLDKNCKLRLTIENDDKLNLFNILDLKQVSDKINVPIVLDIFHHEIYPNNVSLDDALKIAFSTWQNIKPVVHLSSSRKLHEDISAKTQAHADYIYGDTSYLNKYNCDIMCESKSKELSVLKIKNK